MTKTAENEAHGFREGLEDVVAAESAICYIDGARGVLSYAGYDIHDLAEHASFEEVCFLLWEGRPPAAAELDDVRARLGAGRGVPGDVLGLVRSLLERGMSPMDALRTAVSALSATDPDVGSNAPDANRRKAVRLTGQSATIVAAIRRHRDGRAALEPDPARGHAEDFLRMSNGAPPSPEMTRALDIALVLHADHELNA
ncbi:MAG TPA: citrate/2-methylcitrate synthase, partial [Thermoanaerobaculia bacterium]|nr:citrate/2-methylcitrate synthase [Thermoanaerobaculia bacterium]